MISDRTDLTEILNGNNPTLEDNKTLELEEANLTGQIATPMGEEDDHLEETIHREEAEDHLEGTTHQAEEADIHQEEAIPQEEVEDTVLTEEEETDREQATQRVTMPSKATQETDQFFKERWVKDLLAITHIAIHREM